MAYSGLRAFFIGLVVGIFSGCSFNQKVSEIHVISTNNLYGYALSGDEDRVGYDEILMYVHALRNEGKEVILVDAGNYLYGSIFVKVSEGESAIEASIMTGYDALAIGNHEFDFGGKQLLALREHFALAPFVSANIAFLSKAPFPHYQMIETSEGLHFAVISVMSFVSFDKIQQDKVNGWDLYNPLGVLKNLAQELSEQVDGIILLGGFDYHESVDLHDEILRQIPSIVLMVDTVNYGVEKVHQKLVVNSPDSAYGFNHSILEFKDKRLVTSQSQVIRKEDLKGYTLNQDDHRVRTLQDYMKSVQLEVDAYFEHELFYLERRLDGTEEIIRKSETDLTRIITDSFRVATNADIAILNAGSIRSSLQAGSVTYGDLYNLLPYSNTIVTISMMGNDIYHAIEQSVQTLPGSSSTFLHFSGLTYAYDLSEPVGHRVSDVMINGEAIVLNRYYTVALNKFLASGGDGYFMFNRPVLENHGMDIDILSDYMIHNQDALMNAEEDRIFMIVVDQ